AARRPLVVLAVYREAVVAAVPRPPPVARCPLVPPSAAPPVCVAAVLAAGVQQVAPGRSPVRPVAPFGPPPRNSEPAADPLGTEHRIAGPADRGARGDEGDPPQGFVPASRVDRRVHTRGQRFQRR